jgi:hypothetical protein
MITFIEKPEIELPPLPFKQRGDKAHPVFMVKDGKEYFMLNRTTEKSCHYDAERLKQDLMNNGGSFIRFHGKYDNPFDLVDMVIEKKFAFESCGKNGRVFNDVSTLFKDNRNAPCYGAGFIDFGGNLREVSCAFQYRIYDIDMAERLKIKIIKRNGKIPQ